MVEDQNNNCCEEDSGHICQHYTALQVLQLGQGQVEREGYNKEKEADQSAQGVHNSDFLVERLLMK